MVHASMLLAVLTIVPVVAHARTVSGRAFLGANMQPAVVAHTLKNVEEEWHAQAALFNQCDSKSAEASPIVNCQDAPASFGKSCGTVVGAIVQGSSGDKGVTQEYMTDVCGQTVMNGWHKEHCQTLALAVNAAMSADPAQNRYNLDSPKVCRGVWSGLLQEEQKRVAEEIVARQVAEKKAAEAEKLAQETAVKQAAEAAARKKAAEMQAKQADMQAKAAEFAAAKRVEADAVAKKAQEKAVEAADAEREHLEAVEKERKVTEAAKVAKAAEAAKAKEAVKPPAKPAAKRVKVAAHHMPEPKLPKVATVGAFGIAKVATPAVVPSKVTVPVEVQPAPVKR